MKKYENKYGTNIGKWLKYNIEELIEDCNLSSEDVNEDDIRVANLSDEIEMAMYEEHQAEASELTIDREIEHYNSGTSFIIGLNYFQ